MTFRQLEYLCALIEEGAISKAAKKLCISQPALSQQISALEKEYSIEILDRSRPVHAITEVGHSFYEIAHKILVLKDDLENTIGKRKQNKLYVKTIPFYAHTFVPHVFSILKSQYSEIDFKISDAETAHLLMSQRYEKFDFYIHAFDMKIIHFENSDEFTHEKLFDETILLATYKNNPIMERVSYRKENDCLRSVMMPELKTESFVTTTTSDFLKFTGRQLCRELGGFEPKFLDGEPTFARLLAFLHFHDCIAFLPSSVLNYSSFTSQIEFFRIEGSNIMRKVVASYPNDSKLSPIAKRFIEIAQSLSCGQIS